MNLSHLDSNGKAKMVDVSSKESTLREARAKVSVFLSPSTFALIKEGQMKKGDVLTVAQVAGIQAAKRTWELIPLCHPIPLSFIEVKLALNEENTSVEIESCVRTKSVTGVEMEALVACSVAALTVYDMCKAQEKGIRITDLRLVFKSGGKSGIFQGEEK
jgi:molybdenum cofactor biosynthesis protein MoaC